MKTNKNELLDIIHEKGYVDEMVTEVMENKEGYRYMPVNGNVEIIDGVAYFKIAESSYPPEVMNGTATAALINTVNTAHVMEYEKDLLYNAFLVNYANEYYVLAGCYSDTSSANDILFLDYLDKTQKYNKKQLIKKLEAIRSAKEAFSNALDSAADMLKGKTISQNGQQVDVSMAVNALKGYGLTPAGAKHMISDLKKDGIVLPDILDEDK